MAKRQKVWAAKARIALLAKLGGCCAICGTKRRLTFDCIAPQGDSHHRKDPSARMSFYHAQDRVGNLQILCKRHNDEKGNFVPKTAPVDNPPPF